MSAEPRHGRAAFLAPGQREAQPFVADPPPEAREPGFVAGAQARRAIDDQTVAWAHRQFVALQALQDQVTALAASLAELQGLEEADTWDRT